MFAILKVLAPTLMTVILSAAAASAGEQREILLSDGSVLTGEVLSLQNGVYTIRTESMGTLTVPDSRVKAIRPKDASSAPADVSGQLKSVQQQLTADQEILSLILSLKDDPAVQQVLDDPEIMQAVNAGDISALLANPRFRQFMENPTVRDIRSKAAK